MATTTIGTRECKGMPKVGLPAHNAALSDFWSNASKDGGLQPVCKDCWGKYRKMRATSKAVTPPVAREATATAEAPAPPRTSYFFWEKPEDRAMTDLWLELNRDNPDQKMHMLIVGPSGTGKTEGVKNSAERADLPLYKVDCASITTPDKWVGHKEIDANGTHFVLSEHLRWLGAIDCAPGIVLYDEISRLHPSHMNILIPILDGSRRIWVPDLNTHVDVHPSTMIAATANIGMGFSGTYNLDIALQDRFGMVVERNFPPADEEAKVLATRTGLDKAQARKLVEIAQQIRLKANQGDLSKPVSTRALIDTARLMVTGADILTASEYTWVKKFSDDGGASSERAAVRTILKGKVA